MTYAYRITDSMKPSEIVKATRLGMGKNQREFADMLSGALASGCSLALVSHWEIGRINLNYEKMYYLYRHAPAREVADMAAGILRELNPARAEQDVDKSTSNGGSYEGVV